MIKAAALARQAAAPPLAQAAGSRRESSGRTSGPAAREPLSDGLDDPQIETPADALLQADDELEPAAASDDDGALRAAGAEADVAAAGTGTGALARLDEAQLAGWIEAIVERDERALTALYDATLSRAYGLVLRIVRRPALAEEVVEETYFQVWRQAPRFDASRGRASAWLLGMARSRAIDALRLERRHQHESLDDEGLPEPAAEQAGADELLDLARGHADLHRALMRLSAQPRQLVALAFFRGLSHEEIALQTALPLGTVKSQIRRALLSLREALGDAAGEWPAAWAS
ncbi:MAG: sigma-70 family RNA polymerase sigma factor [Rubrivivax sp.]|nr:sigma-70 family RNA polymerase sigma factor [Rubrivivax sp.]